MKGQAYLFIGEVCMPEPERSPQVDEKGAAEAARSQDSLSRLLVIDDDYLHRKIICRVAAKAGYAPAGAATYDEAAKLALENAFDCISLDLSLGQHGGLEMLYYLRGIGCKAPIIIISGTDQATVNDTLRAAKSLNLDIRETVLKPVDLEMLRYSFERVRTQHHTPAAA
jgi:two-component system, chemotaxis family, chemotaxis protein CheY